MNPFAVASWLHLVLARCHPFDVGSYSSHGDTYDLLSSCRTEMGE
jgi:hypothetical protein